MEVYALSGASGTGKSTSALHVAHTYQIDAMIDDGLLIINGEKVAGTSAKFEKNTITAVRRAIFEDPHHQAEVQAALAQHQVKAILLIGTSQKMVNKIANRLQLGEITHYLTVEEIRTPKEIAYARFVRETQGKHVMPIPYKQVEQNFFRRLIQRGMDIVNYNREKIGETTIVRPDFHNETITISKSVYVQVIRHITQQHLVVAKVEAVHIHMQGTMPQIELTIVLKAPVDYDVMQQIADLQQLILKGFIEQFGYEPDWIRVSVTSIETKKS